MANPLDGLGDLFGNDLGKIFEGLGRSREQRAQDTLREASEHLAKEREKQAKKDAPKPQIRAKKIDGVWFVRAEDIAAVMEANGMTNHPVVTKLKGLT